MSEASRRQVGIAARSGAEIDAELQHLASSSDLVDIDQPERPPYDARLDALRGAVVARGR
jgi:hypothetical protein